MVDTAEELVNGKKSFFSNLWKRKHSDPDRNPLDSLNMKKVIQEIPFQIQNILKITGKFQIKNDYDTIVFAGMGGSAAPADLFVPYVRSQGFVGQTFIVKGYDLPPLPKNTLVFAMSYSGNTEETVNMFRQARRKEYDVVILTAGGKLAETARIHNIPHMMLPSGLQPRQAIPFFFFCLLKIFQNSNLIPDQSRYIDETIKALKKPIYKEMAKQLAEQLVGKVPIIYATSRYRGVAHKWKINCNENAKTPAFFSVLPEINHNELIGFTGKTMDASFIFLRDEQEHLRNLKRFSVTKRILKKEGYPVTEIVIKGTNYLTKIFSGLYIGEWTSYFLALHYGKDPTPVDLVEDFKELLHQ
jgi:glucose/mannose-6-phosphate isomerase